MSAAGSSRAPRPPSLISVVIITLNEENNIGRCIDSVKEIADEILVVDSLSNDKTCEIAKMKGATVHTQKFLGYVEQKNFALSLARNEYVLSLDADESLSEQLQHSIAKLKGNFDADGYTFSRLNFYCGRAIKTCGWYPDRKLRLIRKTAGEWKGKLLHEKLVVTGGGTVKHLAGDLLHDTYPTHESFLKQVDKFAGISAQELQSENAVFLILKLLLSPPFRFFKNYVVNLGCTDGAVGWTICYHQAREVFLKYSRALKLKYA